MLYKLAASALALIHLAFILFVVFGGLLLLKWPRVMWLHLPAAVWGALIEFAGWYCPLTSMENAMLRRAGQSGYTGGFVAHYIFRVIYPAGLTRGLEIAIGVFVLVVNLSVYVRVFR
jgi:Protein of Unknown function (DUF2784)